MKSCVEGKKEEEMEAEWGPREVPSGRKWSLVAEERTAEEVTESLLM